MYGGNKLEGNREGNFNILGRKFCFREAIEKGFFVLGKWKHCA